MGISGEFKTSKCGTLTVVSDAGWNKVLVRFNGTGHEKVVRRESIEKGNVFDPLHRGVYGVGFIGVGRHKAKNEVSITKAYDAWHGMLRRCYSDEWHKKKPSYSDCFVCPEWHSFQVFGDWFDLNYSSGLTLDKDKLIKGNREYRPDACCFISASENSLVRWNG